MADENTTGAALNKAVEGITNSIEQLAAAIEKIVPDAWNIMVQQQIMEGWTGLAWSVPLMLFGLSLVGLSVWFGFKEKDAKEGLVWGTIIAFTIMIAPAAFGIVSSGRQLLNPEYYAMQDFKNLIQP